MEQNGLKGQATLRITVGARVANITVGPGDTLESIAARINDSSEGSEARELHYDPDGRLWIQAPVVLATVVLLCAFSAFVLLRAIDMLGARMYPLFHSGQTLPHPTVALGKDD